jgi:hypothetical protein
MACNRDIFSLLYVALWNRIILNAAGNKLVVDAEVE